MTHAWEVESNGLWGSAFYAVVCARLSSCVCVCMSMWGGQYLKGQTFYFSSQRSQAPAGSVTFSLWWGRNIRVEGHDSTWQIGKWGGRREKEKWGNRSEKEGGKMRTQKERKMRRYTLGRQVDPLWVTSPNNAPPSNSPFSCELNRLTPDDVSDPTTQSLVNFATSGGRGTKHPTHGTWIKLTFHNQTVTIFFL